MTSEEAGRKLRYDAFYNEARQIAEKLAAEHGGSPDDFSEHIRIAVAHKDVYKRQAPTRSARIINHRI